MPQKRLSMRKIKEVLRLRFGLGLQQDQIARSCSIGQATVHRYLEKAAAAKVTWPLPDDFDVATDAQSLLPQDEQARMLSPRACFDLRRAIGNLFSNSLAGCDVDNVADAALNR